MEGGDRIPAIWYAVYNVALHLGALVCLPFWLVARLLRGRYRGQFKERMGILPAEILARFPQGEGAVWIHAASAGETAAAVPLVRRLRDLLPRRPFLFTVTSRYGKEMALKRLSGVVDAIAFSPLDLPLFCRRFLGRVRPSLYVMVETDLWPNLVVLAKRRGAKVAIASGHAGPRTFPRPFWRYVFGRVDLLLMQSEADARHVVARGAPVARVRVGGNLKFDGAARMDAAALPAWRAELKIPEGARVLVAGSTLPEDEGPVLDAVRALRAEGVDLVAVVAPRRQERVPPLLGACSARGLAAATRTGGGSGAVLVLDTMGELQRAYEVADVAYVGGGFTPEVGLHNVIEPLVCEVPVLMGPHRGKARRLAEEVLSAGAGLEVADGPALAAALRALLADEARRKALASAGRALLSLHRGAADRQARSLAELLA
ncbi:MAG TPA: glycosyltransferase N-terminal domain-containing protein [Planctomycetota bacterium]|nr:glycosyltransferase N-terminal domain-containing protein [Planctomycetota bacterium]